MYVPGIREACGNSASSFSCSSSKNTCGSSGSYRLSTTIFAPSSGGRPMIRDFRLHSNVLPYRSRMFCVTLVYRLSVSMATNAKLYTEEVLSFNINMCCRRGKTEGMTYEWTLAKYIETATLPYQVSACSDVKCRSLELCSSEKLQLINTP